MITIKNKKTTAYIDRSHERELIRQYQEEKNNDALEELLKVHNPYVQRLAAKAYKQFNKIVEFDDLIQQGRLGLIKAATDFDLNRVVSDPDSPNYGQTLRFLTFAHKWIIAYMQDAWHHAYSVHVPTHLLRAIHFTKIEDTQPISPKQKARMKLAKLAMKSESLDALTEDFRKQENRSSNTFEIQFNENGVRITDPTFEDGVANIYSPIVSKAIEKLSPKEWEIFKLKAGLENGRKYPFPEIAKKMEISVEEVDKLFKRAKRILAKNTRKYQNEA